MPRIIDRRIRPCCLLPCIWPVGKPSLHSQAGYRFFYGEPDDRLCLLVNQLVSDARVRCLESLGAGVLLVAATGVTGIGTVGPDILHGAAARIVS